MCSCYIFFAFYGKFYYFYFYFHYYYYYCLLRTKTLQLNRLIHSTTNRTAKQQNKDARAGLWLTLVNCKSNKELTSYISCSDRVRNKILPGIVNKYIAAFEKSIENISRSASVFYTGGLLSRRKYESIAKMSANIYKAASGKLKKRVAKCRHTFAGHYYLPRLVEYKKLIKFMTSYDIGELLPVPQAQVGEFSEESGDLLEPVSGRCRDLEKYLIDLANLYLYLEQAEVLSLDWFGNAEGAFAVAIGADGAPFGKHNEATAWLISFLNITDRVASCYDNFILLGANCKEDHPHMKRYASQLRDVDLPNIECNVYTIRGIECTFVFELVPADQKWLATFSGELNNAATYPSPFANVSKDDLNKVGCSIGFSECDTWKPWAYSKRLKDVKAVEGKKNSLLKKGKTLSAVRPAITKFIATQKSRQEFTPFLGPIVQKAKCEPLHLANNCWQLWFHELFCIVMSSTPIPPSTKAITSLDPDCCLRKFLVALKQTVKANNLHNKICRWFKDRSSNTDFSCRFTGEETKKFCHGFMSLISIVFSACSGVLRTELVLHALAYAGVKLRDATSLFSRVTNIDQSDINKLKDDCYKYFSVVKVFFHVTLSVWTVGYCVPLHTQQLFDQFGCGLGLNTMQGREAKHQQIKEYAEHSTHNNRWEKVFQHEYMQLVWLRRQNPFSDCYKKGKESYIPVRILNNPDVCYCGLSKVDCVFCESHLMRVVEASAAKGELPQGARSIFYS